MPTNRRPTSGRGQDEQPSKLDGYMKSSKQASVGKNMRTFARTKTSKLVTAWDDDDYLVVLNNYFYPIADSSGNVDSASVGSTQMLALLDYVWELYFTNANLKDLVVAEETAWKTYFCAAFFIANAIQIQYNFRCYLPAYTESDTVYGGISDIPYFSQSSFDIFSSSMAEYPIPKGVWDLVDAFCTWGVQLTKPYEQFTLKIPGSTMFPFNSMYDLADLEAARDLLRVNLGNATTHAQKFGLKMGKWREPVKPTIKSLSDPDVIAYLSHAHMTYYDNQPASVELGPNGGFTGANLTNDYILTEYMFLNDPNESLLHVMAPFFGTYNATNNPYGGIILTASPNAVEYGISALHVSQHGTNIAPILYSSMVMGVMLLQIVKCFTDNYVKDGEWDIQVMGAHHTAQQSMEDGWSLEVTNQLFIGVGRGATETNNDLCNYIGRLLV